jgi:response regulator RpfG family c-di-GMP phosphodiesterase
LSGIPFLLITVKKRRNKLAEAVQDSIKDNLVKPVQPEMFNRKAREVVFGNVA